MGWLSTQNPTQSVFETRVNALEGGVGALATASGAAAITYAVLTLAGTGDNIVAASTLYGGTYALFAHTLKQFGIEARFVDPAKPEDLAQHVDERTRLVFGETVGNPALNVVDLDAWAAAFGDTRTELELQPSGSYKPVTRFCEFVNVADLMAMYRSVSCLRVLGCRLDQ